MLVGRRGGPVRACCALGAHAALGMPPPLPPPSGSRRSSPPARACHALGAHTALLGGPPLPLGSARTPKARAVRPPPPCLPVRRPGMGGPPPPGLTCHVMGAHAAVLGGPPSLPGSGRAPWARAVCPPPSCLRSVCARGWGRGLPSSSRAPSTGGVPVVYAQGIPPCRCCAPLTRAAGLGVPLPLPPLSNRSHYARASVQGGGSAPYVLRGSPAPRVRAGVPLPGLVVPLAGGSPAGTHRGPPLLPCCTPWAHAAGWGCPLSLPPLFGCLH